MPSLITHSIFAKDVFNKLGDVAVTASGNNQEIVKAFSQGPDLLFPSKVKINDKNIGYEMHNQGTKDLFANLIKFTNRCVEYNNNIDEIGQIVSVLYGLICHYVLDVEMHPYIYYRTGVYKEGDPNTYMYNALHQMLETYIDVYMAKREGDLSHEKYKAHETGFNIENFSSASTIRLDHILSETYNINNLSNEYLNGLAAVKALCKYLRYDITGLKKALYIITSSMKGASKLNLEFLSYHVNPEKMEKKNDFLNIDKEIWYNPTDLSIKSNNSVPEIYTEAIDKAVKLINAVTKMIYNGFDESTFEKINLDNSYVTGTNKKDNQKMIHFNPISFK